MPASWATDTLVPSNLNPVAVAGGHSFVELAAGQTHACGVATSGQVYCWGDRHRGAIGDGVTNVSFAPQPVLVPGISAIAVRAGFNSSCALMAGGLVSCWGDDTQGTLGSRFDGPLQECPGAGALSAAAFSLRANTRRFTDTVGEKL